MDVTYRFYENDDYVFSLYFKNCFPPYAVGDIVYFTIYKRGHGMKEKKAKILNIEKVCHFWEDGKTIQEINTGFTFNISIKMVNLGEDL